MATTSSRRTGPVGGHGLGQGSGSGAGQWLSSASLNPSVESVERELGDAPEPAPSGRRYRISAAEAGHRNSAAPDDLFLKLNPSGSGEVDLDLSFDFVSQMENTRPAQTPIREAHDSPMKQNAINGMSGAKRWGGKVHRKQPPTAINVLKKKQHLAANDLTSQFSPISPLDHKRDDQEEEPLTMMQLGASRRAGDAGIVNNSDGVDRAALIRQQRSMAQRKQIDGKVSPKKKTVLGENRALLNAQIGQPAQSDDVFDDVAYHKYLLANDDVPMAIPARINKQSAAASAERQESAPISNALGLTHLGDGATGLGLTIRQDDQHSPMGTQTTTSPALSDLFSDSGTARGSEFTHGSASEGATTPGTAFSTLFDDRHNDFKVATSTQMERGPSAPVSSRPLVNDIIVEEDRLSMVRSTTAPSSTFEPGRHSDDYLEASASDAGGSSIKGTQQMVLSTADSITDDTKFLFRHPGHQAKGGVEEPTNSLAHGLGIDMGHFEDETANQLQFDLSELSVERAMLPEVALDLGDMGREDVFVPSQSFSSSAEGFAINTTPMAFKQPDLRIDVPSTINELSPRETSTKTPRWKTKFWNMTGKSPLSSFRRSGQETDKTPTMKSLLLVDRSKDQDMGPLSAPLPSAAIFAPNLQMPPAAMHSESRYSKSSIMTSRFRYLPNNEGHIQVAVDSPDMEEGAGVRSPKSYTTPMNILTPKMEYIRSAKNRRHSWGYSSDASLLETPTWLTEAAVQSRGNSILRNSTLSAVGNENTSSSNLLQAPMMETIVEDGIRRRIRHRATNSVPVSPSMLPNTWTSPHPDQYIAETPEESAQRLKFQNDQVDREYYDSQQKRRTRTKTLGSRMSIFGPASIAITPYFVSLTGTRNRSKMVKTTSLKPSVYSKAEGQTQIKLFSDDRGPEEGIFAYSGRALENASPSKSLFFAGFLAMPWLWFIGGWGLQTDGTVYIDRDMFWEQENEELIKIELLRQQNFAATKAAYASGLRYNNHQSILPMHRDSVLADDSEQIKDITNERYSMDRPESFIQIIQRNNVTTARPQSVMERSSWMQDDTQEEEHNLRRAPRARSLLLGDERKSIQPMSLDEFRKSVALPGQMNADDMHPIDLGHDEENIGIAYSTNEHPAYFPNQYNDGPKSQWDQFDDVKEEKKTMKRRNTFFHQIIDANTQMMNKLATASARVKPPSAFKYQTKRQQKEQQLTTYVESRSIISILFDDWTKLEQFVLFNRIMALTMSIVVFGAAGVAIWVVVADW